MKKILLLLFVLISQISNCQINNGYISDSKTLSESDFKLAKTKYFILSKSKLYINYRRSTLELIDKLGDVNNSELLESFDFMKSDEDFSKYILQNLSSTKFKDLQEAIALRNLCSTLYNDLIEKNTDLYKLIELASAEQLIEILEPDRLDYYGN